MSRQGLPPRGWRSRPVSIAGLSPDTTVTVTRGWGARATATVQLASVTGLHMTKQEGGRGRPLPRPMLAGYVRCDQLMGGAIAHSCTHGPPPHHVKVILRRADLGPRLHGALRAAADEARARHAERAA